MSSEKSDSYIPRDIFNLGLLLVVASFIGDVIFMSSDSTDMGAAGSSMVDTAEDVAKRIRPVVTLDDILGNVAGGGAGEDEKTPKQLYEGACLACHSTGVANAPKVGDAAAWESRLANGLDALVVSATKGKGSMPPNGGSAYSADEIRAAIEFMLSESGL